MPQIWDGLSRRRFLSGAGLLCSRPAVQPHAARVAVARCRSYGPELLPALQTMFDQLGGLGRLVKGKTVTVKVNLTGNPDERLGHLPAEFAQWTHHAVIGASVSLMGRAGAARIRIVESPWKSADPIEEFMLQAGWEPRHILNAAARVEFENTNYLGSGKRYARLWTPGGGHIFKAFDLNESYEKCDVFVSIAKLKEHEATGITLSMKNCFGITPCTIYGDGAGEDEPGLLPRGGRGFLHDGSRQPSRSALPENDPASPRNDGYRVPRIVADLVGARPVHLAIIDGIRTIAGGMGTGPNTRPVAPGLLIAGTNCVSTDAVATALMGFDPLAEHGAAPFENCDSTLLLGEQLGLGTRNLSEIEVTGTAIRDGRFNFRAALR